MLVINLKKLSSVTDYLLICSAESERQAQAIARSIEDGLRERKEKPFGIEGVEGGRWVLMDYVDVVVHIFHESVRSYYDLEGLWAEAPVTEIKEKPAARAGTKKAKKASGGGEEGGAPPEEGS